MVTVLPPPLMDEHRNPGPGQLIALTQLVTWISLMLIWVSDSKWLTQLPDKYSVYFDAYLAMV
jgi:hypothetical protein